MTTIAQTPAPTFAAYASVSPACANSHESSAKSRTKYIATSEASSPSLYIERRMPQLRGIVGRRSTARERATPQPRVRQLGFMFTRAQSANPVKPPGTSALVAAMRASWSGPKYVCASKYWNISRISWAPG